jgi:glycosyltransferase involved in cell wall biosynthesis
VLLAPLGAANSIIANSTDCLQWIKASVGRRTARRTTVVHNGVREPQGDVVPAPEAGTTHLVVVGRLATRKGQDLAIRAAAVVVQAGHDVHLTLVGDSYPGYEDVSEGYRALAVELGLEQRVSFVGFTDPHPYVRAADVVLVPSRVEPFGLVAVEGMLHGRPVVAAAVGGLPEIIDDGRTGLLVRPEDPSALASAILRLLDDPGAARRLATAGQADARARFSIDSYAASIRELVAAH